MHSIRVSFENACHDIEFVFFSREACMCTSFRSVYNRIRYTCIFCASPFVFASYFMGKDTSKLKGVRLRHFPAEEVIIEEDCLVRNI